MLPLLRDFRSFVYAMQATAVGIMLGHPIPSLANPMQVPNQTKQMPNKNKRESTR